MERAQQLGIAAALIVAVAALVVALRNDGQGTPATAAQAADAKGSAVGGDADGVTVGRFQPKGHTVAIWNFAYDPDPVSVKAGQAIVWENSDVAPHTVTARDGSWDSGTIVLGDAVVMIFDEPGTYPYICTIHPPAGARIGGAPEGVKLAGGGGKGMQGTIFVR